MMLFIHRPPSAATSALRPLLVLLYLVSLLTSPAECGGLFGFGGGGGDNVVEIGVLRRQEQASTLNLQPFTGALGGATAPAITESTDSERPYQVDGDTFTDFPSAADRACDNQKNLCADMVNSGQTSDFEVGDCDDQNSECKSTASSTGVTTFSDFTTTDGEFDIYCE